MRSLSVRMAALCLFVTIGIGRAEIHPGLSLQSENSSVSALALGTTVEVKVTGIIARAKVTQIFKNPSTDWVEGI